MAKLYWVIVNSKTGVPVPALEEHRGQDDAMLVFLDIKSAEACCVYHKEAYEVDCKPQVLGNERGD